MKQKETLKWQMMRLLTFGWIVPIGIIAVIFLLVASRRLERQTYLAIETSMEKASEICELRMSDCIAASREASYRPDIRNAWSEYRKNKRAGDLYESTTGFLSEQYMYNPNFDLTVLIYNEMPENVYYSGNATGRGSASRLRYFKENVLANALSFSETLDTQIGFFNSDGHMYMIRNIVNRSFEPYAVLIMELNEEHIFESLRSVWAYQGMSVWYGGDVMASDGSTSGDGQINASLPSPGAYINERGREVYYLPPSKEPRFVYEVSLDRQTINVEKNYIMAAFFWLLAFLIPLVAAVFYFLQKNVSLPISTLTDASMRIADGNYGTKVDEEYENRKGEIGHLARNFNIMSDKLHEQFDRIFVEEIALRDANIHALQSQINPHFLNNTLEIINWEARMNGDEKVSRMIEALSTMMSATMDRKHQSLISLSEEMEYVHAYIYIIECRYRDRFSYEEEIDESLLGVKVPRLIIQPVIENAVTYCSDKEDGRRVRLKIEGSAAEGHIDMRISIINPGEPSDEDWEKIHELLDSSDEFEPLEERAVRIGIRNVNRRLRIFYGKDSGLSITTDGEGNTVSAIIVKK
ncbi:MAG: histidine kinase [Lachnospiraceae bacterium]|nr:histidine kinase [Lachnospiraceae bacterium]